MQGIVLGIDYGDRYIGFALTDPLRIISYAHKAVMIKSMKDGITATEALLSEYDISHIVIGLPLMLDGSEGVRASKTRSYGKVIAKISGLDVEYVDERYTTMQAKEILEMGNVKPKDMKKFADKLSAQIILESWLMTNKGD